MLIDPCGRAHKHENDTAEDTEREADIKDDEEWTMSVISWYHGEKMKVSEHACRG